MLIKLHEINECEYKKSNIDSQIKEIYGGGNISIIKSSNVDNMVDFRFCSLAGLAHLCYSNHSKMILDPDTVWSNILKGLTIHIQKYPEKYRDKFVNHSGKEVIELYRPFLDINSNSDWEEICSSFIYEIKKKTNISFVPKFSTSTVTHETCHNIMFMDTVSSFFSYEVNTLCYIPEIEIAGTVEDWQEIYNMFQSFKQFELDNWISNLNPVLEEIIKAKNGNPDLKFWDEFYKLSGGSGGPFITGHIINFFPYLGKNLKPNTFKLGMFDGITLSDIPNCISKVQFKLDGEKMYFIGGQVGMQEVQKNALQGAFGWAIVKDSIAEKKEFSKLEKHEYHKDMLVYRLKEDSLQVGFLKRLDITDYHNGFKIIKVDVEFSSKLEENLNPYELYVD